MNLRLSACKNRLEIRGAKHTVIDFLFGLYGHTSIYNRNNKITYFREKKNECMKKKYPTFNTYAKIPECVEIFGYKDFGKQYYLDKWGTELDMLVYYNAQIESIIKELKELNSEIACIELIFDTYRTPPKEWVKSASKCNPDVFLKLKYIDCTETKKTLQFKRGFLVNER